MRALLRYCLAPFIMAAVLSAGAPAYLSAGPVQASVADACPPGTHWDHTLQLCI